jgi:membrane associated rhomboid family serine protease
MIPYNTDAPIYHWPFATVGLIAVNTLVFLFAVLPAIVADNAEAIAPWMLARDGVYPAQWITANFIHGSFSHLLGNMFFLWAFGLVVEGKLGWYRFLPVYFGIGIVQCAGEQLLGLALGIDGLSYGASAIIYGLMATSLIWAPKNDIQCVLWSWWGVYFFEVPILVLSLAYIGLDLAIAWWSGFALSTSTLHLTGALVGAGLGVAMLKAQLVDCEGWDLFNVMFGDPKDVDLDELRRYK